MRRMMTKGPGPMHLRSSLAPQSLTIAPVCWLVLLFGILLWPQTIPAADLVTARYAQPTAQELVVEIAIGEPPPPSLIVNLNLPVGVAIVLAQPATKNSKSRSGEIKWLFKDVKAGVLNLRLTLDRPLASAEISGEVRFRHPKGGVIRLPIAPP